MLLRLIMKKIPEVILPEWFVSNDAAMFYGQVYLLLTYSHSVSTTLL